MLNPKKSVILAFFRKCGHVRGVGDIQNILAPNFDIFKRIFSGKVKFEANSESKMIPGACSPENF